MKLLKEDQATPTAQIEAEPCDQCDGTGWVKGHRCPCKEDDDEARERRSKMGVVPR